ncbi:recombinase family protein [Novosphingobium sp.]|uniref:recombinase family protein n=1 Tax=Novosphingobium sp. TaxID=1874826 RepID=UPI0035B46C01
MTKEKTRFRCAIYTRKSTEEGLDQAFNTLDAQRAACEAYIASQAGEGWECLPEHYDDGGWSGGNMERPALKTLMEEIKRGRIDIVVVYKVDRLTRSLMDFARIVETFDKHETSFVSVTQAFNTTNSMGRLTLNVLLSFAQFEREVTAERIRDKIAASKARGIWMGGNIPLGYDLGERILLPNPVEAEQVRHMFTRYLELGSLSALAQELERDGIRSKQWTSRAGLAKGGQRFHLGGIAHILKNRIYLGEVVHKGKSHKGDHEAIVPAKLFKAVQEKLAANTHARVVRKTRAAGCPLQGKVFDAQGLPMRPTFGHGRGCKIYRYYVSETLLPQGKAAGSGNKGGSRASATHIERVIGTALSAMLPSSAIAEDLFEPVDRAVWSEHRVVLTLDLNTLPEDRHSRRSMLDRAREIDPEAAIDGHHMVLAVNAKPVRRGRSVQPPKPQNGAADAAVVAELIQLAHRELASLNASPLEPELHGEMRAPDTAWVRQRFPVALLAPDIQKTLLRGKVPTGLDESRLLAGDLPLDWEEQRRVLGFE